MLKLEYLFQLSEDTVLLPWVLDPAVSIHMRVIWVNIQILLIWLMILAQMPLSQNCCNANAFFRVTGKRDSQAWPAQLLQAAWKGTSWIFSIPSHMAGTYSCLLSSVMSHSLSDPPWAEFWNFCFRLVLVMWGRYSEHCKPFLWSYTVKRVNTWMTEMNHCVLIITSGNSPHPPLKKPLKPRPTAPTENPYILW